MGTLATSKFKRRVLRSDPDFVEEGGMEFRLTFDGPLKASNTGERNTKPARKAYKHWMRRQFHPQLRRLWEQIPLLRNAERSGPSVMIRSGYDGVDYSVSARSKKFALYGFNFVPLVTKDLGLVCSLDILYLRRMGYGEQPGDVVTGNGDIDNRVKTLLDCLQLPDANQSYSDMTPGNDETPFYVLLENDTLVTKITIEADRLLQDVAPPPPELVDPDNDARVVITVRIRPYEMTLANMQFG